MRIRLLLIAVILLQACTHQKKEVLKLDTSWEFKNKADSVWRSARVPGTVHTDLMAHKQIKDPFEGKNEEDVQWIEEEDWEYRTQFRLDDSQLNSDHIEIQFKGLDTYATVYINDEKMLTANNMFRSWNKDIKPFVQQGNNRLRVVLHSPMKMAREQAKSISYKLPAGNDQSDEKLSVFTRKAPFQYGWDWAPRLVTSGIWKPVHISFWDEARITNAHIIQKNHTNKNVDIVAKYTVESDSAQEYTLSVQLDSEEPISKKIRLQKGKNTDSLTFSISNPEYWWTNGLGTPHLYNLTSTLSSPSGELDSHSVQIGIRTLELVQEKDSIGRSFYFKLNGKKLYMKGANVIPMDSFIPRVSKEDQQTLFSTAKASNMNMLRVWGGGVYGSDYFYQLANEHGILVWQDFIFANSMYNLSDEFKQNVTQEVRQNILRLRNHPSLALWCGNNEIDIAWHNWGWQDRYSESEQEKIWGDYQTLFTELIPDQIAELSPKIPYVSTSPLSNWGTPENFNYGSMHYWGVWHGEDKFEQFKDNVPRFMSEYGFQSYPQYSTVASFADSSEMSLYSDVMKWHQKSYKGNRLLETHMNQYYNPPKDFKSFLYVNQLVQAKGISMAIANHRQQKGHNMGTLYWQLNDVWPVASWSSMDYFQHWKAAQYAVKKSYRDLFLTVDDLADDVNIHLISDRLQQVSGTLTVQLIDFDGQLLNSYKKEVSITENAANRVLTLSKEDFMDQHDLASSLLYVSFQNKKDSVSTLHYFKEEKYLKLKDGTIKSTLTNNAETYTLRLHSPTLIKNLRLSTPRSENLHFSDNYFDLLPNKTYTITFKSKQPIEKKDIEYFSLVNSFVP
ncbi:MAG: glycoside hydrolase family 2 protein [Balneolaceae bacterium]|nr:glycoside hydrolase family 2 protein [Balneolaceae bacterium]